MHTQHIVWDDAEWAEVERARKRAERKLGRGYSQKEYILVASAYADRAIAALK